MAARKTSLISQLSIGLLMLVFSACSAISPEPTATITASYTPSDTQTPTFTASHTATQTQSATITSTPTETLTPTPSETATPEQLVALAIGNGNCRVGPGEAYIPVSVFHEGDSAVVQGRDYDGNWVWVQPPDFYQRCWVHSANMEFNSDLQSGSDYVVTSITAHGDVPAPSGISSDRNNGSVTFTWNPIPSAPEVGYLLEVSQCLNGSLIDAAYATGATSITLNDAEDCGGGSHGTLRGKNKLGYSVAITLPWP